MKVEVYGHSDDCIEVDGDLDEEFSSWDKASFLHFGDGTILEVEHAPDDYAGWRINVAKKGTAKIEMASGTYADEGKCDKAILTGDLKSVKCWGSVDGPTDDDVQAWFDQFDPRDLTSDQALRIMAIAEEQGQAG